MPLLPAYSTPLYETKFGVNGTLSGLNTKHGRRCVRGQRAIVRRGLRKRRRSETKSGANGTPNERNGSLNECYGGLNGRNGRLNGRNGTLNAEHGRRRVRRRGMGLERSPHCERYGTRTYWAKLGPVPRGYDRLKACRTTEVGIHGRKVKPTYCDDKGTDGGVWGYWLVDFNEAGCRPLWKSFRNKGCTAPGSGFRRFEARLMNLDHADRWDIMCSSTPTDFKGLHFDGAMSCANKGKLDVYGSWDIGDSKCR